MKWILLIVVVLVIAGALFLRTSRGQGVRRSGTHPHRLDDSTSSPTGPTTPPAPGFRAEAPGQTYPQPPAPTGAAPGSDFAHEPEIDDLGSGRAAPDDKPST